MPSKSKAQQKFMGAVYALKKGDIKPSDVTPAVRKVAKDMKKSDAKDFASTKHKGLPKKVKQEIIKRLKKEGEIHMPQVGSYAIPSKLKKRKHGDTNNLGKRNKNGNSGQPDLEEGKLNHYRRFGDNGIEFLIRYNRRNYSLKFQDKKTFDKLKLNFDKSKDIDKFMDKVRGKAIKGMSLSLESVNEGIDGLKNAQSRLKKVYKHLDVEYGQTRRGDKYVQIHYIPVSSPQTRYPEWVKVFYDNDKELQKIGKTLKLKLKESVNEGMFSTIDQIRKDSKNVKDFVKNVFADRDFKKMKGDKEFIKYLKSVYEGVSEGSFQLGTKAKPPLKRQGLNHHILAKSKPRRKYHDDDANFKKKDSGQEDLEELSTSEKVELYSLYSKAMKAMPGSPKQKKIKQQINKIRVKHGMKPLKENTLNEIGVFPVQNYIKGIIPTKDLSIMNDRDRERVKSLIKDLVSTLNHFWKSHKIPFRVREPRPSDMKKFKPRK